MSFSTEMLFLLPRIVLSMQFLFLGCSLARPEMVSVIQSTVIGHIIDVQGNLITAEIWQGSLRGGDSTDRRGEEQQEKGKLLLLMFLSGKWGSNRSSSPVI